MKYLRTLLAATLLGGAFLVIPSSAHAVTDPIDIRVEHDLSPTDSGPRVLEVTGVTAGPGPEITVSDEIDNPSGWGGNVLVDIDPDADTITVEVEDDNCYDTVLVEITTDEITTVNTVSDEIFDPGHSPVTLSTSVAGGVVTLSWVSDDSDCPSFNGEGAQSVFTYTVGAPEPDPDPTASLSPTAVEAGDPVTVSGTECPNSPVMATISPEGGDPLVDDVEQVVGEPDGTWSFEIDTTDLDPGTYTVATRCVLADGAGFDYDVLTFTVSAVPVVPVVPEPAPPAQPTPAAPSFTG